jgi:peptidoglycan DL-endopeptidase CwlO
VAAAKADAERGDHSSHSSHSSPTHHKTKERKSYETPAASSGSRGARALAFARRQLGKPYRYASAGPNAYDCSGLTMAAWKSVGVSLPRSSRSQYSAGSYVAKSNLQLGDLVFFYSPISHVALYAGNGTVIHAPRPGKSVEYIKMSYMPYAGAKRPG